MLRVHHQRRAPTPKSSSMVVVLEQKLTNVQEMMRGEFRKARAADRPASVAGFSATIRSLRKQIEKERQREAG